MTSNTVAGCTATARPCSHYSCCKAFCTHFSYSAVSDLLRTAGNHLGRSLKRGLGMRFDHPCTGWKSHQRSAITEMVHHQPQNSLGYNRHLNIASCNLARLAPGNSCCSNSDANDSFLQRSYSICSY
jgi:hypothetical protein